MSEVASLSVQMAARQLSFYFLGKCDGATPLSPVIWFAYVRVWVCVFVHVGVRESEKPHGDLVALSVSL